MLKNLFESLLNTPQTIIQIPELYEFVPVFFEKPNGSLRPIAMQESILNILHTMILGKIK